ncbi:tautomerase family protein [Bradyrhizobium oligotrophicum]|uniref:tautomerase family protein n=1 Tax=Bradyrhizobium oligotrophicum TaxID=44255 RepID=UPI003EB84A45
MPLINIVYASQRRSPSLKKDIADAVTALTARILRKDPKVTAVIVSEADAADWFAGGASLAEQGLASYWIDVHVSEGTNTKDEKAAYLAAVFARMAELIGPLHHETYLHVDEVRGDAYGFGGLTQERRYVAARLDVPPERGAV